MFMNVNYDKLEGKPSDFFTPVVSLFHFKVLIMSYDKLFAAPYKRKKIICHHSVSERYKFCCCLSVGMNKVFTFANYQQ